MTARQVQHEAYRAARAVGLDVDAASAVAREVAAAFQEGALTTRNALRDEVDLQIAKATRGA